MKIRNIGIQISYEDDDGDTQYISKDARTFESAEENLGKLERFFSAKND